jgi:hypothetical protein
MALKKVSLEGVGNVPAEVKGEQSPWLIYFTWQERQIREFVSLAYRK